MKNVNGLCLIRGAKWRQKKTYVGIKVEQETCKHFGNVVVQQSLNSFSSMTSVEDEKNYLGNFPSHYSSDILGLKHSKPEISILHSIPNLPNELASKKYDTHV